MQEPLDPRRASPLWAQLRDALRARLGAGEWAPGALIPREVDLCAAYGVSRITAARAVQELVREGRLRRRRRRGTEVVAPAAAPRRGEGAPALAFVTPRIGLEWALDLYGGFEAVAAEAGHVSLLSSTAGQPLLDAAGIERLLSEHARGLALSHLRLTEDARALLPDLRARGVPLAFVGAYDPAVAGDRVTADNRAAGRLAALHLRALGHRRIAFFGPGAARIARNTSLRDRRAGYREALVGTSAGGGAAGRGERPPRRRLSPWSPWSPWSRWSCWTRCRRRWTTSAACAACWSSSTAAGPPPP